MVGLPSIYVGTTSIVLTMIFLKIILFIELSVEYRENLNKSVVSVGVYETFILFFEIDLGRRPFC